MKFKSMFFVALFAIASLFVMPTAAEAKPARASYNGKTVEIVGSLPGSWNLRGAVSDIDWYTGSKMRYAKYCSFKKNTRCIEIVVGKVSGKNIGYTAKCTSGMQLCRITIDVVKANHRKGFGKATKRWVIRHELGHALTLHHTKACNTMNPYMRCKGHVPPNSFSAGNRVTLRHM